MMESTHVCLLHMSALPHHDHLQPWNDHTLKYNYVSSWVHPQIRLLIFLMLFHFLCGQVQRRRHCVLSTMGVVSAWHCLWNVHRRVWCTDIVRDPLLPILGTHSIISLNCVCTRWRWCNSCTTWRQCITDLKEKMVHVGAVRESRILRYTRKSLAIWF